MPTLLLASCATQRPSSGATARDASRIAFSPSSACCSTSGAGAADDVDPDADVLPAVDCPSGSRLLPPGATGAALPDRDALPVPAELDCDAVSVPVVENRFQRNQPAPPTASRTTTTTATITPALPPRFGGRGSIGGCGGGADCCGHGGGVGYGPVGAQPTGVSGQVGARGRGIGPEPPGSQLGSCCGTGWYGFTPIPRRRPAR